MVLLGGRGEGGGVEGAEVAPTISVRRETAPCITSRTVTEVPHGAGELAVSLRVDAPFLPGPSYALDKPVAALSRD